VVHAVAVGAGGAAAGIGSVVAGTASVVVAGMLSGITDLVRY